MHAASFSFRYVESASEVINAISATCLQFGNTALHEASLNDHFEIVKLLLEHKDHKANIKLQNNVMAIWV